MNKKVAKTAILITFITLSSKFIGFFRDITFASSFGASIYSDAFIMAQSIVLVVTGIVLSALNTTFIPVYSEYISQSTTDKKSNFVNVLYTFIISMLALITLLGIVFTYELVYIFAPKFSPDAFALTVDLTRLLLPTVMLAGIVNLHIARLQSHGNYLIPAAIGYPVNLSMILYMTFASAEYGIKGLGASVLVGTLLQIGMLWPGTRKLGHQFRLEWDLNNEGLRKIGVLVVPIIIGNGIQQINTMVDRILSSGLAEGSVAALNFSNRLVMFIVGLMSAAVASVYYTSMSRYHADGNDTAFKKLLQNTTNILVLVVIPAMIGFMILRLPIVSLVFERGMFDRNASEMTATALFYYAIGLLGYSLRDVLSRAFYAIHDTKTAMINGSMAVVINIVLSISLVPVMGIGGIALGTAVSALLSTFLLMLSLRKKIGDFGLKNIKNTFMKVLISSGVMGVAVHFGYAYIYGISGSDFLSASASIILGVVVYGILVFFMKIEEVDVMVRAVKRKFDTLAA